MSKSVNQGKVTVLIVGLFVGPSLPGPLAN